MGAHVIRLFTRHVTPVDMNAVTQRRLYLLNISSDVKIGIVDDLRGLKESSWFGAMPRPVTTGAPLVTLAVSGVW